MTSHIPLYIAFGAGIISFLSPCVLPLIPGYISFISGSTLIHTGDINNNKDAPIKGQYHIFLNALFFITGFSVVFISLGASATWFGSFLVSKMDLLTKAAGLIIIFFGIFKMGMIRPLFLQKETKWNITEKQPGFFGTLLVGSAFAFGWTPCIGPVLAGILTYAGTLEHLYQGIFLLWIYSMGLGLPFLLTAISLHHFFRFFNNIKKHLKLIETISGIIMVLFGLLIFTDQLSVIAGYFSFLNWFAM